MAKKNKKRAPAASGKIQVKMLKYVEGTGSVSILLLHVLVVTAYMYAAMSSKIND